MTEALHAVLPAIYLLGANRIVSEVDPHRSRLYRKPFDYIDIAERVTNAVEVRLPHKMLATVSAEEQRKALPDLLTGAQDGHRAWYLLRSLGRPSLHRQSRRDV